MAGEAEDSIDLALVAAVEEVENSEEVRIAVEELQSLIRIDFELMSNNLPPFPGPGGASLTSAGSSL